MNRLRRHTSVGTLLVAVGCAAPQNTPVKSARADSLRASPSPVAPGALPAVGIAVMDSARAWCAEFPQPTAGSGLLPGRPVTIVFVAPTAVGAPAWEARVVARREAPCPAAFPQPRWADYAAYDLALVDSLQLRRSNAEETSGVTLAVASAAPWTRGPGGVVRADLDGDGSPEEARRCAADEGEHFTLWSRTPDGAWTRRAHEYYDWGALVDATCRPGEDGRDGEDSSSAGPP